MATIPNPRVCVIGAGVAGLSTARYLKEEGINFTVLESTRYVGGTWRYDPRIGTDENGLALHTSMYKYLRTNLPKPTMELRGYPMPKDAPAYPSWEIYYDYLKAYANHFDLEKHIKFLHNVVSIRRLKNSWIVKHKQILTGKESEVEYDFVVVGTGHYSKPHYPTIEGENIFKGTIIHSHDYRIPDPYKCRKVLIVGAGASGIDIGLDLINISDRVIHSQHSNRYYRTPFPPNYVKKPDIKKFKETGVVFVDDTLEEIDDVIYCTGYEFDYPFIDESCGLNISKHSVIPLYKYMVNINQPTMVVIGLVRHACTAIALDAQARYATALIKGNFTLPSHEKMMEDWQQRVDELICNGKPLSHIHILGKKEDEYYAELTKESGIESVPPVISKIRDVEAEAKLENLLTFRNYAYTVIDKEDFIRTIDADPSPNRKGNCTS